MLTSSSPPPSCRGMQAMLVVMFCVSSSLIVGSTPVNAQSIECVHGWPQLNGACACENCYTGERCDQYASHSPFFRLNREEVKVNPYDAQDKAIFKAEAADVDERAACPSKGHCPCGEVRYAFGTGNDKAHFYIDSVTGEVTVRPELLPAGGFSYVPLDDQYDLQILAFNPDSNHRYDHMDLHVTLPRSLWEEQVPSQYFDHNGEDVVLSAQHHLHKRSANPPHPDNVTFHLTKTGNSENTTEMRVGTRVSFQLDISFPATTTDMLVELFAPDNNSIVMMLCDVKIIHFGSNLAKDGPGNIVMDSQNSSTKFYDRAIIDFGNVTNSAATADLQESTITITWDAVMIENIDTVDAATYYVSAGAEYNYEMEVWVGQASFTANLGAEVDSFDTPTFNLTGPDSIMMGTSAVFTLDMYLTQPSTYITIDAFAPLNDTDVMSICAMKVVDTAVNYQCGFIAEEHTATLHKDDNTRGYGRASMPLGVVTSKGARDPNNPMENNRITVEFVVHVYEDISYENKQYWVGAAVEIGTMQIWAGEILVTVIAFTPTASIAPSWEMTKEGSGKVSTVTPLLMSLDITIPQKTAARYSLEILAPFNDSAAVFQLCSVRVVSVGDNLICTNTDVIPMYSSRGSPMFTDRGTIDLGIINNVGPWGWQPYNLTDGNATLPDVLRVQFFMKATNHSLATVGSQHNVVLGLMMNGDSNSKILLGSYPLEIEASADVPNITEETTPDYAMWWPSGDGSIAIGGAGQFLVSITTKRNTVYAPFDLEALMPNSTGSTQVSVCKVQVHSIGLNLPCLVASAVNDSVTYTSLLGDGLNDRAVLSFLSLCNNEVVNDTAQDMLVLKVGFMLQPDAGLTNGTELWPSVGVMFSPYKMWVGQIKAWARNDLSNSGNPPHLAVIKNSGDVPVGYFASYNVLIKTVPGDVWPYTINVSVSTAGLSVCSVKVLQVGENMPCMNAEVLEAVYEAGTDGNNEKASIDLGSVSNTGSGAVATDNNVDDNTIVVEVMIGVSSTISAGSGYSFTVSVTYGPTTANPFSVDPFNVISDQSGLNETATNVTNAELSVVAITDSDNGTDVVLGQSKRLQMCAWIFPGTATKLTVKMLTPQTNIGVLEVAYIGVASAGNNVPCAGSCKAGVVTYESWTGSSFVDVGTLDLGYLLNNNFDPNDADANRVCVDGVFRVLKNDALTPGDTIKAAASVNVNDVEITISQLEFTVQDNATFTDVYPDNVTLINGTIVSVNSSMPDPLCLKPGDVQTFPLLLAVPAYVTSLVTMDIKLDVNHSACMTYKDIRLISVGKNLRTFGKDYDLQCTSNSSMGTTQMDSVECSFGVVTNPGMSHRCEDVEADDDSIYLEVDLQLADCLLADKDANLTASFGFKVAGYIAILNYQVMVCRDGSEAPVYNITASANSTGNTMYINYDVILANTSSAEIHNSSLIVMPPQYVTCDLDSSSGTNLAPVVDKANRNRMIIDVGSVYFTDQLNLLVRCEANTSYIVPNGISGSFTVVQHQMSGDVIPRDVSALPSQTVFSEMDFVNFTATTVSNSGVSCTSAALGMESGAIYDCQITDSFGSITPVTNGRKGNSGWTPYVRDGELSAQRYIQVFFPNKMHVDRVEVKQEVSAAAKATKIKLAYSNDGKSFLDGDTIDLVTEIVAVPSPQDSKVLRVYVTEQDVAGEQLKLTFEFYGCPTSSGGLSTEAAICSAANTAILVRNPNSLFYQRSFLSVASGTVYVCDGVVKTKGTVKRCFVSVDGNAWQPMDTRVASVLGHEPESDRVFALANDRVTYMSSGDNGLTWESTHNDVYDQATVKANFVAAKNVAWEDVNTLPRGGAPLSANQIPPWGATYDFLKKNDGGWQDKVKFDCC